VVTAHAQLASGFQPAQELKIRAMHIVTGGGTGQLAPSVGVPHPQGMSSIPHYLVMTGEANLNGIVFEQRFRLRLVISVTGKTATLRGVFVSFGPVLLHFMAFQTKILIDVFLFLINSLMA